MESAPAGVGFVLSENDRKEKVVHAISPDGPAARSGVAVGDVIVTIDGRSIFDLDLDTAASLCKGEYGSECLLGIRKKGYFEVQPILVTRGFITSAAVTSNAPPISTGFFSSAPQSPGGMLFDGTSTPGSGLGFVLNEPFAYGEKVVQAVMPGAPAALAGVQVGDIITAVDGVNITNLNINQAAALCRGPLGSDCILGCKRRGSNKEDRIVVRRGMVQQGATPTSSRPLSAVNSPPTATTIGVGVILIQAPNG